MAFDVIQRLTEQSNTFLLCRFDRNDTFAEQCLRPNGVAILGGEHSRLSEYSPVLIDVCEITQQGESSLESREWKAWVTNALDERKIVVINSKQDDQGLAAFLREEGGHFLSPHGLGHLLDAAEPAALANLLGPVTGVLLGSNSDWRYVGLIESFPSNDFTYSSSSVSHSRTTRNPGFADMLVSHVRNT